MQISRKKKCADFFGQSAHRDLKKLEKWLFSAIFRLSKNFKTLISFLLQIGKEKKQLPPVYTILQKRGV